MMYKDIIQLLACVFEAVITLTAFSSCGDKRRGFTFWEYCLGTLVLGVLIRGISVVFYLKVLNFALTVLAAWAVLFCYSGNLKKNFIISFISKAVMSFSKLIVIFALNSIINTTESQAAATEYNLTSTVISCFIAYMIIKIICILHKDKDSWERPGRVLYWILFSLIFIINVTACCLLYLIQANTPVGSLYYILSAVCTCGLLYATFLTLYLHKNIIKQSEEESKQKIYEQYEREQTKYIEEVMSSQNKIRQLRHDLKNHNIALRAYFESGDTEGGIKYLDNIDEITRQMSLGSVNTGNIVIDALVNNKQRIAEEKKIKFTAFLRVPERLYIDSTDICIIFGNALDNAIEACDKVKDKERWISVYAIYENKSLICRFENSAPPDSDVNLKTTKKNKGEHGFGIDNIKTALSKYDSRYNIMLKNSVFTFSFVINF